MRESPRGGLGGSAARTNDDYRRAIRAIPPGRVASYGTVSEVVRGDTDGSQHVAGLAANDMSLPTAYPVVKWALPEYALSVEELRTLYEAEH